MSSDYLYVCCQITPTILDHLIEYYKTTPFKRVYFAIPPFNMHYYDSKSEMMEHVKSTMSYYGIKYYFIDQPCYNGAVVSDIAKLISSFVPSLPITKNDFLIDKVEEKTALLYKYDIRTGTQISDKVYHSMWSSYRVNKEADWDHNPLKFKWSEYEQYWLEKFIDSHVGEIPPIAGPPPQTFMNILTDLYRETSNSPNWKCKIQWWQETVENVLIRNGKNAVNMNDGFNVNKVFGDSQILDTVMLNEENIRCLSRLSWQQNGRYFEWISKMVSEAFGYSGAKSDLVNLISVMLHESGMSTLSFNNDKIADVTRQDMVRYKMNVITDRTRKNLSLPFAMYHDFEFDDTLSIEYLRHIMKKNSMSSDKFTLFAQMPSEYALEKLCLNNPDATYLREFNDRLRDGVEQLSFGMPIEDDSCKNLSKVCNNIMINV
ncbi:hypothetical protein [Emiliania huxleyi virus 99B1]|nr:hypothetical protein EhVM1_000192 [Emiliania huxleyi virus M1]CAZ69513.1 hypothetical protein [Emiliania huxleyi virus 99B1]|mmetsp:Transcript_4261/g.12853  ORF Transcript_4261/g.12853 Transcript_4261/m.12853 type:complete len:431 (-) Transcript_4261:2632-3924(-)